VPGTDLADDILDAGRRAGELTRQLLAFARKQVVTPVTVDLNETLRTSEKLLRRVIGEDVRISRILQPDLWRVRCDPGLLGQVIMNLAVNARDAMPRGGLLTLSTRNVTVSPGDPVPDPEMRPGEYVRIEERLEPGLWPVRADPGLVSQVIMNLAVNARDAMPHGGTLTLSTANVELGPGEELPDPEMHPGPYVRLTVTDTGTGMPPEVVEHVFEPFFTTKGPGVGTGLGLATVYGIVKQGGGHVAVRSTSGLGSTFDVWFPRGEGEATAAVAAPELLEGGSETILVVEDDPKVREVAVRALRAGGYRVLAASGAEEAEALARAEAGPLHALLTDVVMPGTGGREVARRVGP
jgi:signal transduction histidine kinase